MKKGKEVEAINKLHMPDCVHIKACRRMSKIAKSKGCQFGRGCNESCSAYAPDDGQKYVSIEVAVDYAKEGAESIRSGYSEYDVYCKSDLNGRTVSEIVAETELRKEAKA